MTTKRRRTSSLLEDDTLAHVEDRGDEPSPGDICIDCECPRSAHDLVDEGCSCGKCGGFNGG